MLRKYSLILLFCCWVAPVNQAQGTLDFANRIPGQIDAPVSLTNGQRVGSDFNAQLFAGAPGAPITTFQPISPIVTFRETAPGYIRLTSLEIPGTSPGQVIVAVMRAFNGPTWETSSCWGESNPVTVGLTSITQPAATLIGLQPFSVNCIPEPTTLSLLALFGTGVGLIQWRSRRRNSRSPQV